MPGVEIRRNDLLRGDDPQVATGGAVGIHLEAADGVRGVHEVEYSGADPVVEVLVRSPIWASRERPCAGRKVEFDGLHERVGSRCGRVASVDFHGDFAAAEIERLDLLRVD